MPGNHCKKKGSKGKGRAHTPITSKAQRGAMGAALAKKKGGKAKLKGPARAIAEGMTKAELRAHLKESKGKKLPKRTAKKKK